MREAFGGTFMIKLILIFIIIYVSFMAIAINYAKAFRVKNGVINIVEQNQYKGAGDNTVNNLIDDYLKEVGYNFAGNESLKKYCDNDSSKTATPAFTDLGACIVPLGNENNRYYRVITFIHIELPFFNINMTVPIKGETKIIV